MIAWLKAFAKRHWPALRLRTILLMTLLFVATLPGFGALFLRVYENALVRQTEAELIAQGAALAANAAVAWPGNVVMLPPHGDYAPEPPGVDLSATPLLGERPTAIATPLTPDPAAVTAARALAPIAAQTARTTLASIMLVDRAGIVVLGPGLGRRLRGVGELDTALAGRPSTALRRNGSYHPRYSFEWLSRASALRIHHARPIIVNGRVAGVLLLSRSPRALFRGIYQDRGQIIVGIVLILAMLLVLTGLLSRGIARPIEMLGRATRRVAGGHYEVPEAPATAAIEIRALYADFAVMAAAIDRRSQYLRDFTAAISHEFKTPLAAIRGTVELIQDHHATMAEPERERFLANIAADADRLGRLVARLIELARADMASPEIGIATRLDGPVTRVADAFRSQTIAIIVKLVEPIPVVTIPGAAIELILAALVENSLQAGATTIDIGCSAETIDACLQILDNGPGIAPSDRDRLFEPFFTTRRAAGGTGLGLSIARSLLQAHGGEIELIAAGSGAAFSIRLPVQAVI